MMAKKEKHVRHTQDLYNDEIYEFTRKGEYRLRLPNEVAKIAGLTAKLHQLNVRNLQGKISVERVKSEKNRDAKPYGIEDLVNFMRANNLRDGDILHFRFITSTQQLILTKSVNEDV